MQITADEARGIEILLGAVFVAVDAWNRFNRPVLAGEVSLRLRELVSEARGSTNATSFFTAGTVYTSILLLAYGLLNLNERWIQDLVATTDGVPNNLSPPLLAALAVVVVIPRVKPFAALEVQLRRSLQELGAIPWEITRLAHELEATERTISRDVAKRIQERIAVDLENLEAESEETRLYVKLTSLLDSLKAWKIHRKLNSFVHRYNSLFEAIEEEHEELSQRMVSLRAAQDAGPTEGPEARTLRLLLVKELKDLYRQLTFFVAAGVLRCCPRETIRRRELGLLGVVGGDVQTPLTVGRTVLIALSIWAPFVIILLGFNQLAGGAIGRTLLEAARLSLVFVAAALVAYWVWKKLRRPKSGRLSDRPYHQYLLAGLFAFLASTGINASFAVLNTRTSIAEDILQLRVRLPLEVLTVGLAFGLTLLMDNKLVPRLSVRAQRWGEAIWLALFLGLLAVVGNFWTVQTYQRHELTAELSLAQLLVAAVTVGLVMGCLVPDWCRQVGSSSAVESPASLPVPAPG